MKRFGLVAVTRGNFVVTATPVVPFVVVPRAGTACDGASRSTGDPAAAASFTTWSEWLSESERRVCLRVPWRLVVSKTSRNFQCGRDRRVLDTPRTTKPVSLTAAMRHGAENVW
jgi:hypothetical protein